MLITIVCSVSTLVGSAGECSGAPPSSSSRELVDDVGVRRSMRAGSDVAMADAEAVLLLLPVRRYSRKLIVAVALTMATPATLEDEDATVEAGPLALKKACADDCCCCCNKVDSSGKTVGSIHKESATGLGAQLTPPFLL